MAKDKTQLTITLDIGIKGSYISIKDSKGAESEYMILDSALNYLIPMFQSAIVSGVLLSGPHLIMMPPNKCYEDKRK